MTKENVIMLRKQLHHLVNEDRDIINKDGKKSIHIPLLIRVNTSYPIDEMNSYVIWDDENELLYSVEYNQDINNLNIICPMAIRVFEYSSIEMIEARTDKLTTENFFDQMIARGLTSKRIKDRCSKFLQDMTNEHTYAMGMPSTTTVKKTLDMDDKVFNQNSVDDSL